MVRRNHSIQITEVWKDDGGLVDRQTIVVSQMGGIVEDNDRRIVTDPSPHSLASGEDVILFLAANRYTGVVSAVFNRAGIYRVKGNAVTIDEQNRRLREFQGQPTLDLDQFRALVGRFQRP